VAASSAMPCRPASVHFLTRASPSVMPVATASPAYSHSSPMVSVGSSANDTCTKWLVIERLLSHASSVDQNDQPQAAGKQTVQTFSELC